MGPSRRDNRIRSGNCATLDAGVGLGHRPELAGDLLADPHLVDFVEVVAEACLASERATREVVAVAAMWPVALHGVKLSLGSADGIRDDHARRIGHLARRIGAPVVSEHVSFTRGRDCEIGHLTRLPYTRAAVRAVARNVAAARRHLPDVPLLLENTAATFAWPDDELDEPDFYAAIVKATGCELLLDVGNLYANAVNDGRDPHTELSRFPLDRVAMLHVAGGCREDGFYFDTHADPIPDPVWALVGDAIARAGSVPILLERDDAFDDFAALRAEIDRLRGIVHAAAPRGEATANEAPSIHDTDADAIERRMLADAQHVLASGLVAIEPPQDDLVARFGAVPLQRTREILARKRIDDALPHLPRLRAIGEPVRALARATLADRRRAPVRASVHDAWWILEAALRDPALRVHAEQDGLPLRARFVAPAGDRPLRPRIGPFVGRTRSSSRTTWALKGPGAAARVHLFHANAPGAPP